MKKVFIDGGAGTTGLRIADRLSMRKDLEILKLQEKFRKDPDARKEKMNEADVVFLCLPDAAAIEAAEMASADTAVIDTSTAHRTKEGWVYGFPELHGQREKIIPSKRIANPGCHASGFISLISPLVENAVLSADLPLSCYSLTGYSGGGKKMIAQYEDENRPILYSAPRVYGLSQSHKHLPEMQKMCGINKLPLFSPIVGDFYSGMLVCVQLFTDQINGNIKDICDVYKNYYNSGVVKFIENADEEGFLSASALSGRDDMQIAVFGNDERVSLVSRYDNLGKGASGAAIQNMNLLLGLEETFGLEIGG